MADLPVAIRNRLVDYLRGGGAPAAISGLYAELYNGDPQASGSSVQSTVTGSANRTAIAFGASASGLAANSGTVTFAASAAGGATITHLALFDAVTGGNLVASHALTSGSQTVTAGNPVPVQINAGGVTLAIT